MDDGRLLAVMARDPVPAKNLSKDQVLAHRRAELHADALDSFGEIKLIDKPEIFARIDDPEICARKVPTIKELVRQALNRGPAHFYGFINADIILGTHFSEDLVRAREEEASIVLVHRTDVDNLAEADKVMGVADPRQVVVGKRVNPKGSADGIFMTGRVLESFFEYFPDFVIAEPWWDLAFIYWADQSPFKVFRMTENQAMHVRHMQHWSFRAKGARRAYELYAELMTNWPRDCDGQGLH